MSNVARPYAKAAFETAQDRQCLDLWARALQQLAAVIENKDIVDFLHNPQLERCERNDVFLGAVKSVGAADGGHPVKPGDDFGNKEIEGVAQNVVDGELWNFLQLLSQNGRLELLPAIYQQFIFLKQQAENKIEVEITSALELTDSEKKELENKLAVKLKKTVVTNFVIDAKLIGGLKINYGDKVLDASLENGLKLLRRNLSA